MSKLLICGCGHRIKTDTFSGNEVFALIADNQLDQLKKSVTTEKINDLWVRSQNLVKCDQCGDIHISKKNASEFVAYSKK